MASNLLRGLVLGFAIAALPGPIFFLCLRRTLTRGWSSGIAAGLGVATGDGIYAALAAFGVAAVTGALVAQRRGLALLAGMVASLRRRITPAVLRGIGLLSGLAILAFGLRAIASAVSGYR